MTAKFTVDDVVARYVKLGIKATKGTTNLITGPDGNYVIGSRPEHGCCAIGIMMLGRPSTGTGTGAIADDVRLQLDVDYLSFYMGFDSVGADRARSIQNFYQDDYELGIACHEAVTAAGNIWHEADRAMLDLIEKHVQDHWEAAP